MCDSSFRLYWAAMQEHFKVKWGVRFDWWEDPYLRCALPAIQINGPLVAVYFAVLKSPPGRLGFKDASKFAKPAAGVPYCQSFYGIDTVSFIRMPPGECRADGPERL